MKGLIYKDLYTVWKFYRNYVMLVLVFLAASWFNRENLFFALYPCIISGTITVSLISLDERDGWNTTCGFLPFSDAQLVVARYLMGLILLGGFFVLVIGVQMMQMVLMDGWIHMEDLSAIAGMLTTLGLISPAIMLPLIYKFGAEKGRLAYMLVVGATAGITAFLATSGRILEMEIRLTFLPLLAASLAVYGLSCLISIWICEKR